ncbi:MAG TPA: BTAD domain-containing putative transcriptional regulator [Actinophytocola sp.]|uniref:AfsR/SARP family transcriptional regulator n=1 Tax=Actinophytocola sp. TaxID=1872138 RepID=UPI002DDD549E|nr:BTAD domain-containing putative transcriptional regulator [Actinophytocola sp.]HEV2782649.1 BTAD domain-containing putative transcriptional regulator [Actinophytocola sp.]
MRIALLGPTRLVAGDGSAIDLGGARLRMLLARLALDAGRVVPADILIDSLWGEAPPSDATNALQSLVSRLRRGLRSDNGGVLESHPAGYRLAVAREDVDVHAFERLAVRGREELAAGQVGTAAGTLRAALDLWRGPALADVADAPFAGAATTRLAELHAAAVEDRVEADLLLGRHHDVLPELRTLVAEAPLRERRQALLIRALYLSGRQADALAAYETARRTLAEELGVEPSAELRETHLAVLRGELVSGGRGGAVLFGRSREADPPTHPALASALLPARLTSFVGRDTELREVTGRLSGARLVTLAGPGGAGKTRLATEVAAALAATGVPGWFVELAGVAEPNDVAPAVLGTLGLREIRMLEPPSGVLRPVAPVERLVEALTGQQCLIVLDNCEHVITAAATVADALLSRCPGLRILATSREPLAITGEVVFPVGPLEPAEAVRLFVDRATAARPGFALDEGNTATVAEICQRLDGLPLALELAAARLRSMTLAQIADLLDDRFRLLTGGSRTSMPRHRTLRSVVEWSWDLLDKPERVLARRLSVFPAGASVESATAVCADDGQTAADVLYLLASLVDKSLVQVGQADGQPRYRMLETVRAYAAERLAEAGEDGPVHAAFDRYFLELAERAEPHLRGADQTVWLARLSAEHDNVMAAIRHAADAGDADTAIRLAMASGWFWALTGRQREAGALAERLVRLPGPAPAHARATLRLFGIMAGPGLPDKDVIGELRTELAATDAMRHFPVLAMVEPMLALFTGDLAGVAEAMARARALPDPWTQAIAQLGRAFLAENEGRAADAERDAVAALDAFRALGDRWGQAIALGQLSERRTLRGDHAGAIAAYEESIELVSQLGAMDDGPELVARLAMQRIRSGDLDGAERDLCTGLAMARERASVDMEAFVLCGLANVARLRGDLVTATERMDRAVAVLAGVVRPDGHWRAFYEITRAAIAVAKGESDVARAAMRAAFDATLEVRDMPIVAGIGQRAAQLVLVEGDPAGAARLIGIGTALRGTPDLGDAELTELIATLRAELGEPAYDAAYRAGAALSRDDALAELRGLLGS